jgi:superfamily I DNA and/or RNA helicase
VLLKDLKRINVALTRAKKMLVIIGTEEYLKDITPLDKLVNKLNQEQWVQDLNAFDAHMCQYLPKDAKKYLTSLSAAQ